MTFCVCLCVVRVMLHQNHVSAFLPTVSHAPEMLKCWIYHWTCIHVDWRFVIYLIFFTFLNSQNSQMQICSLGWQIHIVLSSMIVGLGLPLAVTIEVSRVSTIFSVSVRFVNLNCIFASIFIPLLVHNSTNTNVCYLNSSIANVTNNVLI